MTRFHRPFILSFLILFVALSASSQNLLDQAHSKKFADYLFRTQQYSLAATEYERILSTDSTSSEIHARLLESFRRGAKCKEGFNRLNYTGTRKLLDVPEVSSEYLKFGLRCNCCIPEYEFSQVLNNVPPLEQPLFRIGKEIMSRDEEGISIIVKKDSSLLTENYPGLMQSIDPILTYKPKKPGLAMVMSAIIPGSGKAYASYWGDAIMSLVFVSSNAWLAYRGFEKNGTESVGGWVFGALSMGFYVSNIWGTGKLVRTHNRRNLDKYYHEAETSLYRHL